MAPGAEISLPPRPAGRCCALDRRGLPSAARCRLRTVIGIPLAGPTVTSFADNLRCLMRSDIRPPTLVIICGLPGAGKTTHARRLEHELPAVRFCPDEWMQSLAISLRDEPARERIEQFQWTLAKRLLSLGQSVLIEWGTWGRSERNRLREEGGALGARVELHYLTAPVEVLFERVRHRGMEQTPITREEIERWAACIQVPSDEEMRLFDRAITVGERPAGR